MNYRMVARTVGMMLMILALCMLPMFIVGFYYHDIRSTTALMLVFITMLFSGLCLRSVEKKKGTLRIREGYLIVVLTWFLACFCFSLPYIISGAIPNFADALFEGTSGITTTGASILTNIEGLPKTMLFWRAYTHWMGGLGILTIAIAVLPSLGISGFQMARAEISSSDVNKTAPKMTDVAKRLYKVYFLLTAICIALLMAGGLGFFDASTHAFSAVATGGFSPKNESVGAFHSLYVEVVLEVFMVIGSISFPVIYSMVEKKKVLLFLKHQEVRFFLLMLVGSGLASTILLTITHTYANFGEALRYGSFNLVSVMTTTGFASNDYNLWPPALVILLLLISICGGCSGSTAGGVKAVRFMITGNFLATEFKKKLHPRAVYSVKVNNEPVSNDTGVTVCSYLLFFLMIAVIGGIIVSLDPGADLVTAFTASLSSMTNLGPGFAKVGPHGNYAFFHGWAKLLLAFMMVVGKLEIFAVLMLFRPSFWNPDK